MVILSSLFRGNSFASLAFFQTFLHTLLRFLFVSGRSFRLFEICCSYQLLLLLQTIYCLFAFIFLFAFIPAVSFLSFIFYFFVLFIIVFSFKNLGFFCLCYTISAKFLIGSLYSKSFFNFGHMFSALNVTINRLSPIEFFLADTWELGLMDTEFS